MKRVLILLSLVMNTVAIAMDKVDMLMMDGIINFHPDLTPDDVKNGLRVYRLSRPFKNDMTTSAGKQQSNRLMQYLARKLPPEQLVKIILKSCFEMDSAQATFMGQYFPNEYNKIEFEYMEMMYSKFLLQFPRSNPDQQAIAKWVNSFISKLSVYSAEQNFQNDLYDEYQTLDKAIKLSKQKITPENESQWHKQLEAFGGSDALVKHFLKLQYSLTPEEIDNVQKSAGLFATIQQGNIHPYYDYTKKVKKFIKKKFHESCNDSLYPLEYFTDEYDENHADECPYSDQKKYIHYCTDPLPTTEEYQRYLVRCNEYCSNRNKYINDRLGIDGVKVLRLNYENRDEVNNNEGARAAMDDRLPYIVRQEYLTNPYIFFPLENSSAFLRTIKKIKQGISEVKKQRMRRALFPLTTD